MSKNSGTILKTEKTNHKKVENDPMLTDDKNMTRTKLNVKK